MIVTLPDSVAASRNVGLPGVDNRLSGTSPVSVARLFYPLTALVMSGGTWRVKVRRAHRDSHSPGYDSWPQASVLWYPTIKVTRGRVDEPSVVNV
jgi:hypothetical protein